jgi:hypothetical protein
MQEAILKIGRQYHSHPVYEEDLIFFFISVLLKNLLWSGDWLINCISEAI